MAFMKLGVIGLGKMGIAIAYRALNAGISVIGYDTNQETARDASKIGVVIVPTIAALTQEVSTIWLMIPHGTLIDTVLENIHSAATHERIIIDGGNSNFNDSIRRSAYLKQHNITFLDCGTSGGLHGKEHGFSLMIGGDHDAYSQLTPLWQAVAAPQGFAYMGVSGSGHYVKMVHNGIEYALMQAYAQGFHLLKEGHFKDLDLATITSVWSHGSIIRSWLLTLSHEIFVHDQSLADVSGVVAQSGMGEWTVQEAHAHKVPVSLIEDALAIRYLSEKTGGNFATKVVALLRNKFGGHAVKKSQ
jgi:6-phosphogluconate dehydrogenase